MKKGDIDKIFFCISFFYIMFPIVIFLLGWCVWYIAIPSTVVLVICFFRVCKNSKIDFHFAWNRKELEKIFCIMGSIALWVYFSGVGNFVYQNDDHLWRNAIFEILVNYDWPAVKEVLSVGKIQTRGMIYYIGFWLPAAVIGKMFGMWAGYCFQLIWAFLGIVLFYYFVCIIRKKIEIWPLVVFIFMSGLDIWGYYILGRDMAALNGTNHLEWWSIYQFSSFTTQLFWVFNQAVPAWLIFMLMYIQKNNHYIVLILSCALLPSTLPFVGMLPFFLYFVFARKYEGTKWGNGEWWKYFYQDTFTVENILGGGITGIISFLYLIGNLSGQNIEASTDEGGRLGYLMVWIVFIIVEVGVYWLAIYKYEKKNKLFYFMVIWLCLCPWIRVGSAMDFCMRASIPALVLLYLMIIQTLEKAYKKKDFFVVSTLVILLLIGSMTSMNEIQRTVVITNYRFENNIPIKGTKVEEDDILGAPNFSGDIENSFFFKYLARK